MATSTPPDGQQQLIQLGTLGGEKFKDLYYSICDTQRDALINFFKETSVLLWDGTRVSQLNGIREFFKRLPPTKHEVKSLDVQPVALGTEQKAMAGAGGGAPQLLVTASGTVQYGLDERKRAFTHTFVLERIPPASAATGAANLYYVLSATCRTSPDAATAVAASGALSSSSIALQAGPAGSLAFPF